MKSLIYVLISVTLILGFLWFSLPYITYYFLHILPFSGTAFNQKQWIEAEKGKTDQQQADLDAQCIRGAMVADIKKRYLTTTTTQTDVVNLLGETKHIETQGNTTCLNYNLGMCSGFKVDYDSLVICFKNERFIEAHTVQH